MLDELSKNDETYRHLARTICKDNNLADDIVQEMYLKLYDIHKRHPHKTFNFAYVYFTMLDLFRDHLKKTGKMIPTENVFIEQAEDDTLTRRFEILEVMREELHLAEKEVLLITHEMSLRKASKELNIHYGRLFRRKKEAWDKLLNSNGIKKLKK